MDLTSAVISCRVQWRDTLMRHPVRVDTLIERGSRQLAARTDVSGCSGRKGRQISERFSVKCPLHCDPKDGKEPMMQRNTTKQE